MRRRVMIRLALAQASFFAFLMVAVAETTDGFRHNAGLSFYGEHWSTAVPYGAGFVLCGYFLVLAANALPTDEARCRTLARLLHVLALLMLGVLLTPDTVNSLFNWSHNIAGASLFLFELSFSAWLALRCYGDWLVRVLWLLQLTAAVLCLMSDFKVVTYLSQNILASQLVFCALLLYAIWHFLVRLEGARGEPGPRRVD